MEDGKEKNLANEEIISNESLFSGFKIADEITNSKVNIYKVNTLEEAVNISYNVTEKNKICLLSPAASSYGFFKNFVEKGEKYKELVKKLYKN